VLVLNNPAVVKKSTVASYGHAKEGIVSVTGQFSYARRVSIHLMVNTININQQKLHLAAMFFGFTRAYKTRD
jgi:peptide deformylase